MSDIDMPNGDRSNDDQYSEEEATRRMNIEFFLVEKNPSDEFRRARAGVIWRYLEVCRRRFEDGNAVLRSDNSPVDKKVDESVD
jgi:hypothetical protein